MSRPLILVSNDDGYRSEGIAALRNAVASLGEVVTVAPKEDQSATSHSLSLHRSLRHREVEPGLHMVDGTPADCIYVGLFHPRILSRTPDVIISGINHGPNLGNDVHYSGTVAAAREGALRGIPSIAFSLVEGRRGLESAAEIASSMVARLLEAKFDQSAPLLNVNFPPEPRGVRTVQLGRRTYHDAVSVRNDPRGREYLWIGGPGPEPHEPFNGSDTEAVDAGYVSVTPLRVEVTHPDHLGLAAFVAGPEEPRDGESE
ncbi:MAG: 5'/3'-nucleotidase SurE [Myxococcota bacterium]